MKRIEHTLFAELHENDTGACGTLRLNRRSVPEGVKNANLKKGDDFFPAQRDGNFFCDSMISVE